jgi:glycerophosphoryl diester phosphodiesterase
MKTTGYLDTHPGTRPRIFAHRGLTFAGGTQVADENTIESFDLALAAGADYLESDIQVTKDLIPVLFHDADLKRVDGKKTLISELTLSELRQIRLPQSGQIPTLEEALTKFPDAKFNLDLKTVAAENVGIETVLALGAQNRVLVSSFSEASRKRALARISTPLASSAGSSKVLASYIFARAGMDENLSRELQNIDALQIPMKRYGIDFTHPKFLEKILPSGVEIHYWTINDPKTMLELYSLGAHGIVTDRADIALATFS